MPRRRSNLPPTILPAAQWGVPVHRLLGGAVRRRMPVTHSIGLIPAEEAEREVAQVAKEGIRTIKIKVGVDPDRDVEMVRRVRETVGAGIESVRRRQPGLPHARRGDPHVSAHGAVPAELCRAAGRGHRAPRRGCARDRRAGDGGRKRMERARRRRDHREACGADRVDLHHQARRALPRHGGGGGRRAAGIICNVNGSVETGIGNLANIQLAAAAPAADAVLRRSRFDAGRGAVGAGRRHLLQGRPDRSPDAVRRWRDRSADGSRDGNRRRRGENPALQRRRDRHERTCARTSSRVRFAP